MNALDQCQTVIVQLPAESIVYEWLYGIHTFYRPIHTYLSIFMCAVGTICNFCNIVVLTRLVDDCFHKFPFKMNVLIALYCASCKMQFSPSESSISLIDARNGFFCLNLSTMLEIYLWGISSFRYMVPILSIHEQSHPFSTNCNSEMKRNVWLNSGLTEFH